jgi:hypothetical protein
MGVPGKSTLRWRYLARGSTSGPLPSEMANSARPKACPLLWRDPGKDVETESERLEPKEGFEPSTDGLRNRFVARPEHRTGTWSRLWLPNQPHDEG